MQFRNLLRQNGVHWLLVYSSLCTYWGLFIFYLWSVLRVMHRRNRLFLTATYILLQSRNSHPCPNEAVFWEPESVQNSLDALLFRIVKSSHSGKQHTGSSDGLFLSYTITLSNLSHLLYFSWNFSSLLTLPYFSRIKVFIWLPILTEDLLATLLFFSRMTELQQRP